MKKFLGLFVKGKQKDGNMYSRYDVSVPGNENDNLEKNCYKHYLFDSDRLSSDCSVTPDTRTSKSNEHNFSESTSKPCILTTALMELEDCGTQYEKDTEPPVSDISKSSSESSLNEVPTIQEQKPALEGIKKSKKNMYVITISNSKYFHIGSQKTVNVGERILPRTQVDTQPCVNSYRSELQNYISQLLDCENKLTEEFIMLISEHANDKWRQFLGILGLEEGFIQKLETRNDNDKALTVYDGLQEYITLYPNTSIGFVINALNNTQQTTLVEKLAQEIKICTNGRIQAHITQGV